ncbi:MAG: hypothetical protein JW763_06355 [candidate division Zixibacteria bacterium]|nr:hypothetical protein [candidate division Zixibacteria bacterium]
MAAMELLGKKPDRKIVVYFLTAIVIGTVLLSLPVSSTNGRISFVDALFTSTSAVCVTGLTVLDTGKDFSTFGQVVILLLIQFGGLGIMTLTTALLVSFMPRLSFKDRLILANTLGNDRKISSTSLLKSVIAVTLAFELIGAVVLFALFSKGLPVDQAAFDAVFHSVSAFCNAGFSTFSDSLESFSGNVLVIAMFSFLIICGGLGFIVIAELFSLAVLRRGQLSLHCKLCLSLTGVLLVGGTIAFYFADFNNAFDEMGIISGLANAFFQAVTARTAGFNTVPQAGLTEVSLVLTMILMFIGACPGSTGGGVKATTFGIVMLLAYNRFLGRNAVKAFRRSISTDSVSRALTVILIAVFIIVLMLVTLLVAEEKPLPHRMVHGWFGDNLFEVISAFGTVGLSLGMTEHLHDFGKIIIILLMFIGRVGLLTLVLTLAHPPRKGEIVYVEEPVMVG